MRFNPKARLDRGQVSHGGANRGGGGLGGARGGGGARIPIPTSGRGLVGTVLLVAVLFVVGRCTGVDLLGGGPGGLALDTSQVQTRGAGSGSDPYAHCETGEDANRDHDCGRVAVVNSIQAYWSGHLEQAAGTTYRPAQTVTFSGAVSTGCGRATSDVGPFYCPAAGDMKVYLDPSFFDRVLEGQLRGPDGAVVEWYVLGHEYGHHVSNLTGQMSRVRTQQGPDSDAVMLELQADCYAGLWMRAAVTTEDASGEPLFAEGPSDEDLRLAIAAAETVGDDHIQRASGGRVDPGRWTHGSSAQRIAAFKLGYQTGDYSSCAWDRLPRG